MSYDEAMRHCINITCRDYTGWIQNWNSAAKNNPESIFVVRYEELNKYPEETMNRVLDFFDIIPSPQLIQSMIETKIKKSFKLKESLKSGETKRNGKIGGWKNKMTKMDIKLIKQLAGNMLIEVGYEKDLNW